MNRLVFIMIYAIMGVILEENKVIVQPAYWALYGAIWGGLIMRVHGL